MMTGCWGCARVDLSSNPTCIHLECFNFYPPWVCTVDHVRLCMLYVRILSFVSFASWDDRFVSDLLLHSLIMLSKLVYHPLLSSPFFPAILHIRLCKSQYFLCLSRMLLLYPYSLSIINLFFHSGCPLSFSSPAVFPTFHFPKMVVCPWPSFVTLSCRIYLLFCMVMGGNTCVFQHSYIEVRYCAFNGNSGLPWNQQLFFFWFSEIIVVPHSFVVVVVQYCLTTVECWVRHISFRLLSP